MDARPPVIVIVIAIASAVRQCELTINDDVRCTKDSRKLHAMHGSCRAAAATSQPGPGDALRCH